MGEAAETRLCDDLLSQVTPRTLDEGATDNAERDFALALAKRIEAQEDNEQEAMAFFEIYCNDVE